MKSYGSRFQFHEIELTVLRNCWLGGPASCQQAKTFKPNLWGNQMDTNKKVEHLDPRLPYSYLFVRKRFVLCKISLIPDTPSSVLCLCSGYFWLKYYNFHWHCLFWQKSGTRCRCPKLMLLFWNGHLAHLAHNLYKQLKCVSLQPFERRPLLPASGKDCPRGAGAN